MKQKDATLLNRCLPSFRLVDCDAWTVCENLLISLAWNDVATLDVS